MTELFSELTAVRDVISEKDHVFIYLLPCLIFDALVTAFETNEEVPEMEIVTERLLHTEGKTSADLMNEKLWLISNSQCGHLQFTNYTFWYAISAPNLGDCILYLHQSAD